MELYLPAAVQLAYALGIGLLIGLERSFGTLVERGEVGQTARDDAGDGERPPSLRSVTLEEVEIADSAGVRTFSVLALLGFTAATLGEVYPWTLPVTLFGVSAILVALYWRSAGEGLGITTELAALSVTGLGALCRVEHHLAAVLGLLLAVVLASKRTTHGLVRRVRQVELNDTLTFLVVVLIVLPLLPDRPLDPYEAFNPYEVGVLVVLISGIGFAGYFLTRILGAKKGLGITGLIGGITSSTAVTAAMAQRAKQRPDLRPICAFATVAANATMFIKTLVVVTLLDRALASRLVWSIGGMALAAAVATAWLWRAAGQRRGSGDDGDGERSTDVPLTNPFAVGPALKFAALFVVVLFVLKLAKLHLGDEGLYLAAAIGGLADVDPVTLSVADGVGKSLLAHRAGAIAITIAVVANSVTKSGISISTGGWAYGRLVAASLALATLVGLTLAFVV